MRLWLFFREWWRTVASAGPVHARAIRLVLLMVAIIRLALGFIGISVPSALTLEYSSPQSVWLHGHISVESILAAVIVLVILAWTGALAWFRTSGPTLVVADQLEEDTQAKVYRLHVHVEGHGVAYPWAFVERIIDEHLEPIQVPGGSAAIELWWSNYLPGQRPALSRHVTSQSVGVVSVARGLLRLHGDSHSPEIDTLVGEGREKKKVYIQVGIYDGGEKGLRKEKVVRWFSFVPELNLPMFHQALAEEPPWPNTSSRVARR